MRKTVSPRRQPEPVKVTGAPRRAVLGETCRLAGVAVAGRARKAIAAAVASIADTIRPGLVSSLDN
jgi:hypothetical protein